MPYTLSMYTEKQIIVLIINMKKLLDSEWLEAVQFKCNTSTNYTLKFWIMIG